MPKAIRIYPKKKPVEVVQTEETKIVPNITTFGVPAKPVVRATKVSPPPKPKAKPKKK